LFAIVTANPDSFFESGPSQAQPGDQAIVFFVVPGAEMGVDLTNVSAESLAQSFTEFLTADSDEPIELGEASAITLEDGVEAGRVGFSGGTGAGVIVVYPSDPFVVAGVALGYIDEFADFEPLALEIIASFEFDPAQLQAPSADVLPLAELLVEDAPVQDVIVDVDMAHDDMFALLLLLNHPQVNVRAVTVVGTGEAHCEAGVRNARGLLELSGNPDIPVACGRETPLAGDHEFPASWRADADSAYGVALPDVEEGDYQSALELITSVIESSSEPITIFAVGPLTNIAELLEQNPALTENIGSIYIMGGAIEAPGNVGIDDPVAEWNIYIDPYAANIVLRSGAAVTLVPLDATQYVPVTRGFYGQLGMIKQTPEASFVYDMLGANLGFIDSGGFQFWDSLTAAIVTDVSLATFETRNILVEEAEGVESGVIRTTEDGVAVQVAVMADRGRFETLFLATLNYEG
jgi:pyrimidine-specific ribonucleoside hydrolase